MTQMKSVKLGSDRQNHKNHKTMAMTKSLFWGACPFSVDCLQQRDSFIWMVPQRKPSKPELIHMSERYVVEWEATVNRDYPLLLDGTEALGAAHLSPSRHLSRRT